jgi:hypothetical protein
MKSEAVSLVLAVLFMFLFAGLVSADKKEEHDKDKHRPRHFKSNCKENFPSLSEKNCDAKDGKFSKDKFEKTCVVEKETKAKCDYGYKALFAGPTITYTTEYFKKHKFIFEKCSVERDDYIEISECYEWQWHKHKKGGWKRVRTHKCEDVCYVP